MNYYTSNIVGCFDYYPFGMVMPERNGGSSYRYSFNGYEKDDEVKGSGNYLDFGNFGYDTRLGRRWNIDPIVKPHASPYVGFENNPIWFADLDGMDTLMMHRTKGEVQKNGRYMLYKVTFSIIKNGVETALPLSFKQVALYRPDGVNIVRPKDNKNYKLEFKTMGNHSNWKNTIRVRGVYGSSGEAAIFMHPVAWGCYFGAYTGCIGSSGEFDDNGKPILPEDYKGNDLDRFTDFEGEGASLLMINYTEDILTQIRYLYDSNKIGDQSGDYAGNSFILKGGSKAPRKLYRAEPIKAKPIPVKSKTNEKTKL